MSLKKNRLRSAWDHDAHCLQTMAAAAVLESMTWWVVVAAAVAVAVAFIAITAMEAILFLQAGLLPARVGYGTPEAHHQDGKVILMLGQGM